MKPVVRYVVENVHMAYQHRGLKELLKKDCGVDLLKLKAEEICLMVNRDRSAVKAIGYGGSVLGYLRLPKGDVLKINSVRAISEAFGGSGFIFSEQTRKKLAQVLGDKSGKLTAAG